VCVCLRWLLWQPYQPQFWYFEVCFLLQKVALACIGLLLDGLPKIVFLLFVVSIASGATLKVCPL
jgi:hypothetical protein